MPLIRFETARDLFDTFPTARQDVDAEPTDAPSLDYLRSLADSGALDKAVTYCAYLLPRREAVAWGCRNVKSMLPAMAGEEQANLRAAEDWVRRPEEEQRLAALELGLRSDHNAPSSWLALAAGWSGGNVLLGIQNAVAPAPPQQTARAVRAAVIAAAARVGTSERKGALRACVDDGIRIASEEGA